MKNLAPRMFSIADLDAVVSFEICDWARFLPPAARWQSLLRDDLMLHKQVKTRKHLVF